MLVIADISPLPWAAPRKRVWSSAVDLKHHLVVSMKGLRGFASFLGCKRTSIREKPYEAMHRLLPFFLPMIFTRQAFCRTQLRLQCAWQSNVLGSGWKHCYRRKHMETKARWVVKCLTASTTPTPSRLCELKMARLTRMLQNDSDFSREQTRTDVSFCGFFGKFWCRNG